MDTLLFLKSHPVILYSCITVIALGIGSLLGLLTYRLPILLFKHWYLQCTTLLSEPRKIPTTPTSFNLFSAAQCPQCYSRLAFWQCVPLLSFILQRGQYLSCQHRIAWRYPLLELLTLILTLSVVAKFGLHLQMLAFVIMTWFLLAITWIDLEYQIIPDELTFILLWLGLLLSLCLPTITPADAIIGAVSGYLFLWIIGHLYHLLRKQEGIGYGDYKLFAALGAWFGWQSLPIILLIAAAIGSVVGLFLLRFKQSVAAKPMAFGPYLAIAGWCVMMGRSYFL